MYNRLLSLPGTPERSFFLWGPRQTGKSSLLKKLYPDTLRIDLLKSDVFARYLQRPHLLREELLATPPKNNLVIIDEIQKVPALLDEVHWLIEEKGIVFILCGSSARKLKRGVANLLAGRALRYELHGLVSAELDRDFSVSRIIQHGYLPLNYKDENPIPGIRAYIADYLKEEIAAEGIVRNLPAFGRFLEVAAISDTEIINYTNIASDCGVSSPTVKEYFNILVDTLLGTYLPAYTKKAKRKVIKSPKFYMFDVGTVNVLARRGRVELGSPQAGHALENWIFHELCCHRAYKDLYYDLSYWQLAQKAEVDFVINDMEVAIEVTSADRLGNQHLKGLREVKKEYPNIKRRIIVCGEPARRISDDNIEVYPFIDFVSALWGGEII